MRIKDCILDLPLLQVIANDFTTGSAMLQVLDIGDSDEGLRGQQPAQYIQALEALLKSFIGLKGLYIDYDALPRMVHKDCITRHAATLERLAVGSYSYSQRYRLFGEDLETVLSACINLTQLGVSVNSGYLLDYFEADETFLSATSNPLDVKHEFESTLVNIF
jgi:hypothetical protein